MTIASNKASECIMGILQRCLNIQEMFERAVKQNIFC